MYSPSCLVMFKLVILGLFSTLAADAKYLSGLFNPPLSVAGGEECEFSCDCEALITAVSCCEGGFGSLFEECCDQAAASACSNLDITGCSGSEMTCQDTTPVPVKVVDNIFTQWPAIFGYFVVVFLLYWLYSSCCKKKKKTTTTALARALIHPNVVRNADGTSRPAPGFTWARPTVAGDLSVVRKNVAENCIMTVDGTIMPKSGFRFISSAKGDFRVERIPKTVLPENVVRGADGKLKPAPGYKWQTSAAGNFTVVKKVIPLNCILTVSGQMMPKPGYRFVSSTKGDFSVEKITYSSEKNKIDHYKQLGVDNYGASCKEIGSAFRNITLECHPDRGKKNAKASVKKGKEEWFRTCTEAASILKDPKTRWTYDKKMGLHKSLARTRVGTCVTVVETKNATYNGKQGTVTGSTAERAVVKLESGKSVSLKPENLMIM